MALHLVTGARGFIGRYLSRLLAQQGHEVVGLGHGTLPKVEVSACGLIHWQDGAVIASNLDLLSCAYGLPDVVFHLAGGSSVQAAIEHPLDDFLRTVVGTAELLEWLRRKSPQARLVVVSSAAVYGAASVGPIPEAAPLKPCSPYGHHKMMMESLCHSYGVSYGLPVMVARLFSVYGAGLRKQLLWDICSKLDTGVLRIELGGNGSEVRDWTDVRDVVAALTRISMLATREVPVLNVGSGVGTSVREIASGVLAAWDSSGHPREVVFTGRSRDGDPFSMQADATNLNELRFEWRIPVSQGIQDYVRWFKSRNRDVG